MKQLLLIILFLLFSTIAWADSTVTFTWQPNSESDLKEYRLYQSDTSGDYVLGIDIPVAVIPAGTETVSINVTDGTWFWILTAVDEHNNQSDKSNEVTADLDSVAPEAPTLNVVVTITVIMD